MPANIYSNYYITRAAGGWSPCIEGNTEYGLQPFAGSVLPNCVGYICGRFNEKLNTGDCRYFGNTDARNLYALGISQGLSFGNDPVAGGVICFDTDYRGHAVIIERVIDQNTVEISESGWRYTSAPIVRTYTMYRSNGAWQYSGGTYQGIIYPPAVIISDTVKQILLFDDDFLPLMRF